MYSIETQTGSVGHRPACSPLRILNIPSHLEVWLQLQRRKAWPFIRLPSPPAEEVEPHNPFMQEQSRLANPAPGFALAAEYARSRSLQRQRSPIYPNSMRGYIPTQPRLNVPLCPAQLKALLVRLGGRHACGIACILHNGQNSRLCR